MIPSQAITSTNEARATYRRGRRKRGNNNRNRLQQEQQATTETKPNTATTEAKPNTTTPVSTTTEQPSSRTKQRNRRRRGPKAADSTVEKSSAEVPSKDSKAKKGKQSRRKKVKYPWRRYVPKGCVDPISLEALVGLPYPPFALRISEPYVAIDEWPPVIPKKKEEPKVDNKNIDGEIMKGKIKQRQHDALQQQWGNMLEKVKGCDDDVKSETTHQSLSEEELNLNHVHLFDGRALAIYLVSQLQFIDPLNRRDLTRDELVKLDLYLKRHNLTEGEVKGTTIHVVKSYDEQGLSISKAGVNGQSESGRERILQQSARNVLNSIFDDRRNGNRRSSSQQDIDSAIISEERGVYSQEGFMMIDDDLMPGLRNGIEESTSIQSQREPSLTMSNVASIPTWLPGITNNSSGNNNFPELSSATTPSARTSQSNINRGNRSCGGSKSQTLSKIGKLIQKTDPKQLRKQTKAREKFIQKMELNNSSLQLATNQGLDGFARSTGGEALTVPGTILERNRNLASALGVRPSNDYMTGWARPTISHKDLDEFGNELMTQYPDNLIIEARERMSGVLLKLEKKWKTFLEDDKAASCPLKAMDRPTRRFVHEYSDFWKLHTESFDPEPRRYIHCVKLKETSAPYPLLSEAVKTWRGPSLSSDSTKSKESVPFEPKGQAAGEFSREFPQTEERIKLQLMPKSSVPLVVPPGAMFEMDSSCPLTLSTSAKTPASSDQLPAPRFAPLLDERDQRIRLNLDPRTLPLEPSMQNNSKISHDMMEDAIQKYDARIQKAEANRIKVEERKEKILKDAFASDSEDGGNDDSESDWEADETIYSGGDDDEEI